MLANVLGFNMSQRHLASGDIEIGRAAQDAGWLVRSNDVLADGLKQRFKRRAVGVLGSVAVLQVLAQLAEVNCKCRRGHGPATLTAQLATRQARTALKKESAVAGAWAASISGNKCWNGWTGSSARTTREHFTARPPSKGQPHHRRGAFPTGLDGVRF